MLVADRRDGLPHHRDVIDGLIHAAGDAAAARSPRRKARTSPCSEQTMMFAMFIAGTTPQFLRVNCRRYSLRFIAAPNEHPRKLYSSQYEAVCGQFQIEHTPSCAPSVAHTSHFRKNFCFNTRFPRASQCRISSDDLSGHFLAPRFCCFSCAPGLWACTCSKEPPGKCPGLQSDDVVFLGTVTDVAASSPPIPNERRSTGSGRIRSRAIIFTLTKDLPAPKRRTLTSFPAAMTATAPTTSRKAISTSSSRSRKRKAVFSRLSAAALVRERGSRVTAAIACHAQSRRASLPSSACCAALILPCLRPPTIPMIRYRI